MPIKSSKTLVSEAMKEIKTISPSEALKLYNENKCNLIDIRDSKELEIVGSVENAVNISRGLLEFGLDPESAYFKEGKLDISKEMVLFCAAGGRSALSAKALQDMGFTKVSHIEGGFKLMKDKGFKIK